MARPSLRAERRGEIIAAFESVFAAHGHQGATVAAVAAEAGVSPGIIHHYFRDKEELVHELLRSLRAKSSHRFREQTSLHGLLDAALRVNSRADPTAAGAWVGIFAVALRAPALRRILQRDLRATLHRYEAAADGDADLALGLLATTVGFLLLGALAPTMVRGRAAGIARRMSGS